jgi:phosphatidylglycerophosphate synthase
VKPPNDLSHKGLPVEEWLDMRFFRPLGIWIARALYPTGISPDQVTLWSLLIGLVAGHLFAYQDRWTDLIGVALFVVSDVFDSADGQLARLRGTSTRFGRTLDGASDSLRFINLYGHLIYRLGHAGWWWPGATLLVALAGLAHAYQSAAVDFARNAFLYIGAGSTHELDLPEDLGVSSRDGWLGRFSARVYRDYVVRQAQFFPRSAKLIRLLRHAGVTDSFRAEYRERQQLLLPLWTWLGQNIRFILLGAAGFSRHISAFLWAEAIPMSLLLVVLILVHEWNATALADALEAGRHAYARVT